MGRFISSTLLVVGIAIANLEALAGRSDKLSSAWPYVSGGFGMNHTGLRLRYSKILDSSGPTVDAVKGVSFILAARNTPPFRAGM